ncbi:MAG: hypothetical protein U0457_11590 [Candidatus Sericytochromatia bacterium]
MKKIKHSIHKSSPIQVDSIFFLDNENIITSDNKDVIKILNIHSGECTKSIKNKEKIYKLRLINGLIVVTEKSNYYKDKQFTNKIYDPKTGNLIKIIQGGELAQKYPNEVIEVLDEESKVFAYLDKEFKQIENYQTNKQYEVAQDYLGSIEVIGKQTGGISFNKEVYPEFKSLEYYGIDTIINYFFNPLNEDELFISGRTSNFVQIWNLKKNEIKPSKIKHNNNITHLKISLNNKKIITISYEAENIPNFNNLEINVEKILDGNYILRVWDINSLSINFELKLNKKISIQDYINGYHGIYSFDLSNDNKKLMISFDRESVDIYDTEKKELINSFKENTQNLWTPIFVSNNRENLINYNMAIIATNTQTGQNEGKLNLHIIDYKVKNNKIIYHLEKNTFQLADLSTFNKIANFTITQNNDVLEFLGNPGFKPTFSTKNAALFLNISSYKYNIRKINIYDIETQALINEIELDKNITDMEFMGNNDEYLLLKVNEFNNMNDTTFHREKVVFYLFDLNSKKIIREFSNFDFLIDAPQEKIKIINKETFSTLERNNIENCIDSDYETNDIITFWNIYTGEKVKTFIFGHENFISEYKWLDKKKILILKISLGWGNIDNSKYIFSFLDQNSKELLKPLSFSQSVPNFVVSNDEKTLVITNNFYEYDFYDLDKFEKIGTFTTFKNDKEFIWQYINEDKEINYFWTNNLNILSYEAEEINQQISQDEKNEYLEKYNNKEYFDKAIFIDTTV